MREDILRERYYRKDDCGNIIEDWPLLCERVARAVAKDDNEFHEFYTVMHNCVFLPNTPALTNAGRPDFTMSACFVLPVEDSINGIFDTLKNTAIVHKMGGGTGFSFSRLRPAGDIVGTTKGIASGPCSFMKVFNTSTEIMKQGGTRRGANMAILRVDHPDIFKFTNLKENDGDFQNFNISVAITDEFMKAVKEDSDFPLRFGGKIKRTGRARDIWETIIERAWSNGEPGLFFIDTANRHNQTPHVGEIEATNPCGEIPLLPYEACVLGSVNLSRMVTDDKSVDWVLLRSAVETAVRMLDNIIDIQQYPIPEIESTHKGNRKIGVGVMGWADMLIKMGINYASQEAVDLAETVMATITETAEKVSIKLAEKSGVFPNWEGSTWEKEGIRVRNAAITMVAPTGTLSIIAETSSGIEPVFDFETEQVRADKKFEVIHPLYKEWREKNGSAALPEYFIKANDVPAEWHIKMQAAFQKHIHSAVSKTINMPDNATKEDVEKAYLLAYESGCKGITIYRNGSRRGQIVSSKTTGQELKEIKPILLPKVKDQKGVELDTTEGTVHISITIMNGKPLEIFLKTPENSRYDEVYDVVVRLLSIGLRCGIPLDTLLSQLEKANRRYGTLEGKRPNSPISAIMRAFRMVGHSFESDTCPDCTGTLVLEEGCMKCISCGYSKC